MMNEAADRLYERLLVVRCQAGDEAAFGELVSRYSPRLRFYLRKMLGASPAAEDALQDVWLDAVRSVARLSDPAAFPAWIYRITRDRAYRELRRMRIYLPLPEENLVCDEADADAFTADDSRKVHAAIDSLQPEHREVVVLRFLESMSYDDIARVVGCQVGTVRSRLHYAKRALRRILEGTDGHE